MWLLNKLLKRVVRKGQLSITNADGKRHTYGAPDAVIKTVALKFNDMRVAFSIAADPGLGAGEAYMNGRMDVVLRRIPNALSVPAKAIFTKNGKPVIYARERGAYVAMEVEVEARNPDETAIRGPKDGTLVALVEPEKER